MADINARVVNAIDGDDLFSFPLSVLPGVGDVLRFRTQLVGGFAEWQIYKVERITHDLEFNEVVGRAQFDTLHGVTLHVSVVTSV